MLSRVADSLYWMSRYIERAEDTARFLDVNQTVALEPGDLLEDPWMPVVLATGDGPLFQKRFGVATRENVLQFLTFDAEYPHSILSCARNARENARTVRESISTPMWEEINKLYLLISRAARETQAADLSYDFFHEIKRGSQLIAGVTDGTLSRGEGWHFVRLGRLIERADKTSRILDVKTYGWSPDQQAADSQLLVVQWTALLQSVSALEMYRRVYGRIRPADVAEFLLLDREFPRSVRYCLRYAEESLHVMSGTPTGSFTNRAEQLLGRLRSNLDYTNIGDVLSESLHAYIDRLQINLNQIGEAVHECYFAAPVADLVPASR
jgi:uncharacterized alpha-E superfamily protein